MLLHISDRLYKKYVNFVYFDGLGVELPVRTLGRALRFAIPQSERVGRTRRTDNLVAVDSRWAGPLRARLYSARRSGCATDIGNEPYRRRRKPEAWAGLHRAGTRQEV